MKFIIPRGARAVVKRDKAAEDIGAIKIPEKYKRRPTTGVIISVGDIPAKDLKEGDRILFGMFSGTECGFSKPESPNDVEMYLILNDEEMQAIIVGDVLLQEQGA